MALARVRMWLTWVWKALRSLIPINRDVPERRPYGSAACLLRTARALIEAEENWAIGAYRTVDGRHCAVGALRTAARGVYERNVRQVAHRHLLAVAQERGFRSVEQLNDKSTHAEVLWLFDAACHRLSKHR
jgi:hypothetical protein